MLKIGIDIHGVADQRYDLFRELAATGAFEVHIVTGIKEELDDVIKGDFNYDRWFSIHQQCENEGHEITYDEKGRPWVDPDVWNGMKAKYCAEVGIDIMFDDSPTYADTFKGHETLYCLVTNTERDEWRHEEPEEVDIPDDAEYVDVHTITPTYYKTMNGGLGEWHTKWYFWDVPRQSWTRSHCCRTDRIAKLRKKPR